MLTRQTLRRFTGLALTAMLGLALAPTVSRALSVLHAEHGGLAASTTIEAPQHEVCTEAATPESRTAASLAEAPSTRVAHHAGHDAAGDHDHLNHCPMCGIAATAWTVAPAVANWDVTAHRPARHAVPIGDAAPRAATVLSAHRPRGPPSQA